MLCERRQRFVFHDQKENHQRVLLYNLINFRLYKFNDDFVDNYAT